MICGFPHQHLNGVYWIARVWRTAESRSTSKRRDSGKAVIYWRRAADKKGRRLSTFSFKKKNTGPKVQAVNKRGFEKVEEDKDDIEIITGVDEKGIAGTKPKEIKEELVIPLIQSKWFRVCDFVWISRG